MRTVAVDIDNVLAVHAEALMDLYNQTYGTNFLSADYDEQWSWMKNKARMDDFHARFIGSGLHGKMTVVPGAQEALKQLSSTYKLVIITARWNEVAELTLDWVEQHFTGVFSGVHFAQIWQERGKKVSKAEICRQIDASYLIDDNISHCVLAAEAGINSVLFGNYSWNSTEQLPDSVVRAADWTEVLDYFRAINISR